MKGNFLKSISSAAMLAGLSGAAYAQSAATPTPVVAPAEATSTASAADSVPEQGQSGGGLQEIIVTAQRRSENLQKAAIAVSVVSPEALRAAGVTNPQALTALVPALQISTSNGPNVSLYLRGVGGFSGNVLTESAVAFNYDGVYIGRPSGTTGFFYDLDRVEVLKGPQGTLYGRNATGGAINVIPAKPVYNKYEGAFSADLGNYSAVRLDGMVNVPLATDVALRVAGVYAKHDGYLKDGTDDQNDRSIRAQLAARPTSRFDINIDLDYYHAGGLGPGGQLVGMGVNGREGVLSNAAQPYWTSLFHSLGGTNFAPFQFTPRFRNETWGISSTMNYRTDFGTFTFIPSYRHLKPNTINGSVGSYYNDNEKGYQESGELRYASPESKPLRGLLGAYYYKEHTDYGPWNGNFQYNYQTQNYIAQTRSYAAFARLTYEILHNLRLTGGIRYTTERKYFLNQSSTNEIKQCLYGPPFFSCAGNAAIPYNTVGLYPGPYGGIANGTINPDGSITYGELYGRSTSRKFNKVTYRAGAEWDVSPRNLVYASFETGYKSGGFYPDGPAPTFSGNYDPETIDAWTFGSKNRFLNNRLQANLELFYWKYKNQQVSHVGIDGTLGEFPTENVASGTYRGGELEITALPLPNTQLGVDVQYLDASYGSFSYNYPNFGAPPVVGCAITAAGASFVVNCSGKRPPQAPKWTMNLSGSQTVPMQNGGKLVLNARAHYQSNTMTALEFLPQELQKAYWTVDAGLTYRDPTGMLSLTVYGNNLGNTTIKGGTFQIPYAVSGDTVAQLRPPRTYGVRLAIRY